jgi:hypothetical protein
MNNLKIFIHHFHCFIDKGASDFDQFKFTEMTTHFATLHIFSDALQFYQNTHICCLNSGYPQKHLTIITSAT